MMDLAKVQEIVRELNEADYTQLWVWMGTEERQRRASANAVAKAEAAVVGGLWEERPELKPDFRDKADGAPEWVQPTGAHAAYPQGAYVTHKDRTWRNTLGGLNAHEPSATGAGWEIVAPTMTDTATGEPWTPGESTEHPLEWEPGLPLSPGQYVTHDGKIYCVKSAHISHDGWVPGPATHAVFEEVHTPRPGAVTG